MVQTTIIRTPNVRPPPAPQARETRRPPSFEEHGSLAGTILMVVFSLAMISWVLLGAA
jgi:hypothetical protein